MRRLLLGALLIAGVALAGCTSGTAPTARTTTGELEFSQPATSPASPAPVTPTDPVSSSAPSSSSSSHPPSSPAQVTVRTTATVAPRSTCRSITVRVIRGSADRGREFAALQFTNTGSARCSLAGYPVVTLRLAGRTIGTPSQPATPAASRYDLAPGATAESKLNDYTDCQAPLSDAVHVVVPGTTQTATRPGQLRACTLRVGALGRPD